MATWPASCRRAMATIGWSGAGISLTRAPSATFQMRTTLSAPAVATFEPSAEAAKSFASPLASITRGSATGSCQARARPSEPAETTTVLLGW